MQPATTQPLETSVAALLLVATLAYAAYRDWTTREVGDSVWLVAGLLGAGLGAVVEAPRGGPAFVLWLLVAAFVVEHVVPWDVPLERVSDILPGLVEVALYGAVGAVLVVTGLMLGLGPAGVPVEVVAVYVSVVVARVLFELGVLYGGADAKAIMIAGLLLPLYATPLVALPANATAILSVYPFTLTLLMDAALFAVVIPLGLAARNLYRGTFELGRGFTTFRMAVSELPYRFVWLREPGLSIEENEDVETTEEDIQLRTRQAEELTRRGIREVWVTPQLPFIVFLWAGAVAALVVGNLLFDLLALL